MIFERRTMHRWVTAGAFGLALVAAGCGGGDEEQHAAPSSAHAATPQSTAFRPAAPGTTSSGDMGSASGFVVGGAGGGRPHLGGVGGALHDRLVRRRDAIERAHRPPGPERLDGQSEQERLVSDWRTATTSAHPITGPTDDLCERMWAQHVATTESFHATRHDGLHSAVAASDRASFLEQCRAQPPQAQQCMDREYLAAHQDECQHMRDTEGARIHRQIQAARRAEERRRSDLGVGGT
jgi:hypothetical protein